MRKRIRKIGDSHGIIFDLALMNMARAKTGDWYAISLHEGGKIILTPLNPRISRQDVSNMIKKTLTDYSKSMKQLA